MTDYQNGYSVFDRLSSTETQSSAGKRHNSPKGNSTFPAFSGYAIRSSRSPSNASVAARSIQPSTSSSSHLVSPKIFDRLASTETYASAQMKGKIAAQPRSRSASAPRTTKTSSAFFSRMAYTETFASAQMKGLIDTTSKKNDGRPSSRGRSSAGRSVRSEAKGTSFWDRMSKTETFASATMKGIYNSNQRTSTPTVSPKHYASGRSSPSARSTSSRSRNGKEYTTSNFFDRLSKMETLSSLQKKKDVADAARSYHSSSPNSFSRKKPMSFGGSGPSRGFGSSSTASAPSTTKKYVSPSNRSVGSMRSATSARTTARSVATTRSATTARSIGTLGTSTVRSNISNKSSRSSYSSGNTLRVTHTAARKPTSTASQRRGLPPPSSSVLSRLGFPPPSPKSRSPNTTSRRRIETSRASSSSPQPIYSKKSPIPVSSASNLHRPKPKPRPKPQPTRSKVSAPKSRSAPVPTPVPIPVPPPQAPPRPVLKFDDDDELSFGSEDSDEASLGPASVKAPQDGGSVASKSIASRKSAATTAASDSSRGAAALGAAASLTIGTGDRRGEEEVSVHDDIDDHDIYTEKNFATAVEEESSKPMDAQEEFIQETETDDFLDEFEDASPAVSAEEEERSEHYEEEVDNSGGEEHIDDFLDDLDDENEPETHEEAEEEEVKEELAPRVPLVHESDDELSFGSDDGDDDWLGEATDKNDNEAVNGEDEERKDPMEEAAEVEPDVDELDEPGGVIDSDSESSDIDPEENTAHDDGEADIPMEDEHSNESEMDVPMDDVESEHSDESMSEEEVQEDDGDEAPEEAESDSDHIDYDDEEYDEEPQIVEEEYDEQEDLDHMDSLDLVLDATNSNEAGHDHEVEVIDGEDEFDAGVVEHSVCKYKILKSEKYHPEFGLEEVHPDDLYLKETLQCFEDGDISNEEIAVLIIEALFEKDFENGDHWEIDPGTAREMEEDEGGGGDLEDRAFVVKRQARLDWNDLYSVAAAKGTIIIDPEKSEIRVENYSYFVAG